MLFGSMAGHENGLYDSWYRRRKAGEFLPTGHADYAIHLLKWWPPQGLHLRHAFSELCGQGPQALPVQSGARGGALS